MEKASENGRFFLFIARKSGATAFTEPPLGYQLSSSSITAYR